jgi:hypothetical protein
VRLVALPPYSAEAERRSVALRPTLSGGLLFSGLVFSLLLYGNKKEELKS